MQATGLENLNYSDKVSMIRNRYKTTKDLYIYMTERRKYFNYYMSYI